MAAYEGNNARRDAIKLFLRMLCKKVEYEYITIVSVISACISLGALDTGKWLLELIAQKGIETSVPIMNALINKYLKCGCIELAKDIFERLPHRTRIQEGKTAVISNYCSQSGSKEVLEAVIAGTNEVAGKKEELSMGKDSFSIAELVIYYSYLLGIAGCLIEAYEFFQNMPIAPDSGIWGALLGACRIHSNVELAELVTKELLQLDPQSVIPVASCRIYMRKLVDG
ncbi:pentatricopeptide repeat-containing protein, putative [Ricinus communis]|uniref:Pentatricopeptide repeat-containing protein, putative n=1 Tax=Ricinus communis TaxID=3988 RepID=B9T803_RICCO|nr:pentatricopeptide repeat-containing protein, putative [Ricinus communis]